MSTASEPIATVPNITNAAPADAPRSRALSRIRVRALPVAIVAALVGGAAFYRRAHVGRESTDDAQLEADVVSVPARVGGVVTAVRFADNQEVKAGDLLAELDDAQVKAKLAQADAELLGAKASADSADAETQLVEVNATGERKVAAASLNGASIGVTATSQQIDEAKAALAAAATAEVKAKVDLDRARALLSGGSITGAQFDTAQAAYDTAQAMVRQTSARIASLQSSTVAAQAKVSEASARLTKADAIAPQIADAKAKAAVARARVATAQATRDLAALELTYTKIVAPRAGVASKRTINVGQSLNAGQTIVLLVPVRELWITANFKETQVGHMRAGQPVDIHIDAYDGRTITGTIESFSGATGARFALLPPDNATGNFTKVVQRVPVRIVLTSVPSDVVLRPGLSVDVTVDTRK